jgi:hypothetical protein
MNTTATKLGVVLQTKEVDGNVVPKEVFLIKPDFYRRVPRPSTPSFPVSLFPTNASTKKWPKAADCKVALNDITSPLGSSAGSEECSPSSSPRKDDNELVVVTFEITSSSDVRTLGSKLEMMERVLHYAVHEAGAVKSENVSREDMCRAVLRVVRMAGFGLKSLGDWSRGSGACVAVRKLLNLENLAENQPCVKAMHDAGQLFFFVQHNDSSAETASNTSSLSLLRRQVEELSANKKPSKAGGELRKAKDELGEARDGLDKAELKLGKAELKLDKAELTKNEKRIAGAEQDVDLARSGVAAAQELFNACMSRWGETIGLPDSD